MSKYVHLQKRFWKKFFFEKFMDKKIKTKKQDCEKKKAQSVMNWEMNFNESNKNKMK
jgi:hypothetical protein